MSAASALQVRFWGVRGSYPAPGPATARIGGNSSCVEVRAGHHTMVFDAGTGIINLGQDLLRRRGDRAVHIFLSHTHHDHIEGLRFFQPAYRPDWQCFVYGGGVAPKALQRVLASVMGPLVFPVSFTELSRQLSIRALAKRGCIALHGSPSVEIHARHSRAHPKKGVMLYRVSSGGRSVVYATDIEAPKGGHDDVVEFARGADVLIHDAQYTDQEYSGDTVDRVGWGHSTVRMAAEVAREAGVKQLVLFHHDPMHNDAAVRRLERTARAIFPHSRAAIEGLVIRV